MGIVVGVDASRNRSGGAITHLVGMLSAMNPTELGIKQVHVWSYNELLKALPDEKWLIKHSPEELEKSMLHQLWWQRFTFPKQLKQQFCDIVLNTDAGTIGRFSPSVTMSRDMLSYEAGEMDRYKYSKSWVRLLLLKYMQNSSLKAADGAVFLTKYAAKIIQTSCGILQNYKHIPHGVGAHFRDKNQTAIWPNNKTEAIKCLYVSNTAFYKHQWHVVEAINILREKGINIEIIFAGGGHGSAQEKLTEKINKLDPERKYVSEIGRVQSLDLPDIIAASDIFIFASSCENMPNTLVEAMSVGVPIACSDRGPMPEVLQDTGIYFNPEDSLSISNSINQLIENKQMRESFAKQTKKLSTQYSWEICAFETWTYLKEIAEEKRKA